MDKEEAKIVYQLGETVSRLESKLTDSMNYQAKAFESVNHTLQGIERILSKYSDLKQEQSNQKLISKGHGRDIQEFKEFMKRSNCKTHDLKLDNLKQDIEDNKKADGNQNKTIINFVSGTAIAIFTAVLTVLATWLTMKKG